MKKKLLTVALAATMVVSSALSAFAATADFENAAGQVFINNSGNETLTGDFDVTYKFDTKGYLKDGNPYETVAVELTNAGVGDIAGGTNASYMTAVIGNKNQWFFNDAGAEKQWAGTFTSDYSDVVADGKGATEGVLRDASVECNIKRTGEKLTIDAKVTGKDGKEATYSLSVENTAGWGETVNIHLTSESASVSNVTFTKNEATTTAPAGEGETTTAGEGATTTAPAATTAAKDNTAANTGDSTMVVALLAVAALSAVVVLKKKTVTE